MPGNVDLRAELAENQLGSIEYRLNRLLELVEVELTDDKHWKPKF